MAGVLAARHPAPRAGHQLGPGARVTLQVINWSLARPWATSDATDHQLVIYWSLGGRAATRDFGFTPFPKNAFLPLFKAFFSFFTPFL